MPPNTGSPDRTGEAPKANAFDMALCGLRPRARKAAPYAALRPLHPSPSGYFAGIPYGYDVLREGYCATDPAIPLWGTGGRPDKNRSPRAVRGAGALATCASTGRRDRQPAPPIARRLGLLEMRDNCEGVSPVPPLPLSHTVRWPESLA